MTPTAGEAAAAAYADFLKKENRRFCSENGVERKLLAAAGRLLAASPRTAPFLREYAAAFLRRERLLSPSAFYKAGQRCGAGPLPCGRAFFLTLCRVFSSPEAEALDALLWKKQAALSSLLPSDEFLSDFTELLAEVHRRSDELLFEVFAAGYLAEKMNG